MDTGNDPSEIYIFKFYNTTNLLYVNTGNAVKSFTYLLFMIRRVLNSLLRAGSHYRPIFILAC